MEGGKIQRKSLLVWVRRYICNKYYRVIEHDNINYSTLLIHFYSIFLPRICLGFSSSYRIIYYNMYPNITRIFFLSSRVLINLFSDPSDVLVFEKLQFVYAHYHCASPSHFSLPSSKRTNSVILISIKTRAFLHYIFISFVPSARIEICILLLISRLNLIRTCVFVCVYCRFNI